MLENLKREMLELIELSAEIAKLEQIHTQHFNELNRNYNEQKCERIRSKIKMLEVRFDKLKGKWF